MRSRNIPLYLIAGLLAGSVFSSLALAAGITAKAGLAQAQQAAKKWKADAVVVNISAAAADSDGTADRWTYIFYAPKTKQGYTVEVKDGKIVEASEVGPHLKDPLGGEFVDSPQAMAEAKNNGLKVKGRPTMSLLVMGQATKSPGAYWTVGGGYTLGEVSVLVNAKTGKFFMGQEAK